MNGGSCINTNGSYECSCFWKLLFSSWCLLLSRSNYWVRGAYWVFKADVLCKKNAQHTVNPEYFVRNQFQKFFSEIDAGSAIRGPEQSSVRTEQSAARSKQRQATGTGTKTLGVQRHYFRVGIDLNFQTVENKTCQSSPELSGTCQSSFVVEPSSGMTRGDFSEILIIGSAEALPILCVSDFLCVVERERDACDVIDITLKSRVIMHMITSTARWPYAYAYASTRSEPAAAVECSKCATSQNHKQQLLRPRSGPSKIQQHIPEQPGWMNSKYWENIEKRNQINNKNYWK